MKAILEFDLPDEKYEYKIMNNADKYHTLIWDLRKKLRDNIKYNKRLLNAKEIYEWLNEEIIEENIELGD
jgi:hypothetical protein